MKADFSTTGLIHIQVASRLSDLLFDELEKINIDGAPLSAQRIHLKALNAPAPSKNPCSTSCAVSRETLHGSRFTFEQASVVGFDLFKERVRAPDLPQEVGGRLSRGQFGHFGERGLFRSVPRRGTDQPGRTELAMSARNRFAGIGERIDDDLDRLIQMIQFSSAVGKGFKIEVGRQDLARDLLDLFVGTNSQESVDRELDIVSRIRNAAATVFQIEHCGSATRFKDFVRLSGQKRPDRCGTLGASRVIQFRSRLPASRPRRDAGSAPLKPIRDTNGKEAAIESPTVGKKSSF